MMAMSFLFMLMLGMGGGGDLLDFMPSQYYWQQDGLQVVNADEMLGVLNDENADATDRLMAIRALGELKDEAHLAVLEPLVDSDAPFVATYARRSIAWIKGEDPAPPASIAPALLAKDVALLPPDATMAGQLKLLPGNTPVDWAQVLPNFPPNMGMDQKQMIDEINQGVYEVVQMIGNARLDALTFSVPFENDDDGAVIVIVRGEYDRFRVMDALEDADDDFKGYSVDDIEIMTNISEHESFAFIMPSDDMLIAIISENENAPLPIDEVTDLLSNDDAQLALNDEMRGQLDQIDRENVRGWFITSVPAIFTQEQEMRELFGPLDAARITATDTDDGMIRVDWVGEGNDEAAIAAASEIMNGYLAEGRREIREEVQHEPAMRPMFDPMIKIMDSITITAEGKTMTGGMILPGDAGTLMPMMIFGGF